MSGRAPRYLIALSEPDPVAAALAERWGTLPAAEGSVDGAPLRELAPDRWVLRRPGPHIHDERLDLRLPAGLRTAPVTILFPSVHRSESGRHCLTVHPLGNPGPAAELGGRPRTLVPTDPRTMASALRGLSEGAAALGTTATFEATHHGPELGVAATFVEIAVVGEQRPTDEEVAVLERVLRSVEPEPSDRVALGVGGGHYAPRFTDLTRSRQWAFGHLLSRHALGELDPATARSALAATPDAEGIVFARAQDRGHPAFRDLGPELKESLAPPRGGGRQGP
jgi:D-aminoacyl-tRNA deacylase